MPRPGLQWLHMAHVTIISLKLLIVICNYIIYLYSVSISPAELHRVRQLVDFVSNLTPALALARVHKAPLQLMSEWMSESSTTLLDNLLFYSSIYRWDG